MIGETSELEEACLQAQDMINKLTNTQQKLITDNQLSQKSQVNTKQSIQSRLTRLYFDELSKLPHATPDTVLNNLENECDLLGRLVQRDCLHTLIVNLYAGNKGYSLGIRNDNTNKFDNNNCLLAETQLMGYEQGELLSCIDNGQLPPILAEQLELNHSHLFYDGCIIAEIRDYRKTHLKADIHHVLLKPTTQSVLSDVTSLTNDGEWSHEERLLLESRLIAATQGPLCLDPNPVSSLATTRLRQSRTLLNDQQLIRQAKKYCQVTANRKRKLEQLSQFGNDSGTITIQDLMQRVRAKRGAISGSLSTAASLSSSTSSLTTTTTTTTTTTITATTTTTTATTTTLNLIASCPPPSLVNPPLLPPTSPIDVLNYAKAYERPRETKDCLAQLIEEYILETERGPGRVYHIKLSILQRPSNSEYLGELYVDRDYKEGEKNGSSCRFTLGTRVQANHYMQQFTEIFTEEGRKNVRIKHVVPGQAPRVTCTPGMQRAQQAAAQAQQLLQQQLLQQQILSRTQAQLNNPNTAKSVLSEALNNTNCIPDIQELSQNDGITVPSPTPTTINPLTTSITTLLTTPTITTSTITTATTTTTNSNILNTTITKLPNQIQSIQTIQPVQNLTNGLGNCTTNLHIDSTQLSVNNNSAPLTLTDGNSINGSGIYVLQQKSCNSGQQSIVGSTNNTTTNLPVLQAQLQSTHQLNNVGEIMGGQGEVSFKKHSSNPEIRALVTSLMNSADQFQQQQAAAAMSSNNQTQQTPQPAIKTTNNAAILSLLNSSPANLTQQKIQGQTRRISLNTTLSQRVIGHGNMITVPSTTGQVRVSFSPALTNQLAGKQTPVKATAVRLARVQDNTSSLGLSMPGLSALLAGTPSADNPIPGMNAASSLLERLTASSNQNNQPLSPLTSPPPANLSLQGVNLTSLPNPINGLQNVQVSFPGLSQSITMPLNVSATTASVTPAGVIVSLPLSTNSNICTTVSSMVAATVVTTATAGSTPTVVIANPPNTHLSLPIAQILPSGVKGLTKQNIRATNAVALSQSGHAIQLVGSQRTRINQMTRQIQSNHAKSTVLPNQLVTVSKPVTGNQLILSSNKQVLTPIMTSTKPVLMATQTTPSSQVVPANKHTLLTKSLHAIAGATGQINTQSQGIGVASFSPQQIQQLQQCLVAQQKNTVAANSSPNRTQILTRNSATTPNNETL
ncbi:hypothetical protein HCN44_010968 [Aphidius gifuensis]|uniref:Spt20-like SEP domain-containing protein n=1 Tax=Aphidius gifuensis TaxID=684658 RepID=A0A834Y5J1_APHGI|nr:transcription factor SPT20 homolog [Aphidius gifuensis]KAF7998560.1 hypothetical protein HCN44_010968 [Aphidius gifuensis]